MTALDFEMVFLDQTLVYHSLLCQLAKKQDMKNRDDSAFYDLAEKDLLYYKSDLFFTMHPILFSLAQFHIWLREAHPSILLKELLPTLTPSALSEINNAELKIAEAAAFLKKITKADSEQAAQKFKALFAKLRAAEGGNPVQPADNFKK
jgi:hypothetical protein